MDFQAPLANNFMGMSKNLGYRGQINEPKAEENYLVD